MHTEINALLQFLGQHNGGHPVPASLPTWLEARFQGHWHTSDPEQGSAYRSLDKHCLPQDVAKHLDLGDSGDWTIWVDPGCVCARFEARGPFTCIYGKLPNIYKHQRDHSETEEEALSGFYSPVKSSRAIAIVPPSARLAPSVAIAPPTPANLPSAPAGSVTASAAASQIHSPTPVRPSRSASPVSRSGSAASSSGASSLFSHARSVSSASSSSAGPSRPSSAQSFVKEHLNGKVGVLGGGIMLGQNAEEEENSAEDTAALQADKSATSTPSASSSDSEATAQQQQKPRRRREHRGKRGSGKQARALAQQKAPRWCALEHHHAPQQFNHHQAWYMQPNVNMHQYAY